MGVNTRALARHYGVPVKEGVLGAAPWPTPGGRMGLRDVIVASSHGHLQTQTGLRA